MKPTLRIFLCFLLCVCLPCFCLAQDPEKIERFKQEDRSVIWVQGETSGNVLSLTIVPGRLANRAIRIYSEPSHTLLALVADRHYLESGAGKVWAAESKVEEASATAITKLPEAAAKLALAPPPKEDERIAVHVMAMWPNGIEEDRIVADAMLGDLSTFDFSASLGENKGLGGITWTHCCSGGGCSQNQCKDCPSYAFTCCLLGTCCTIECGWKPACTCLECNC